MLLRRGICQNEEQSMFVRSFVRSFGPCLGQPRRPCLGQPRCPCLGRSRRPCLGQPLAPLSVEWIGSARRISEAPGLTLPGSAWPLGRLCCMFFRPVLLHCSRLQRCCLHVFLFWLVPLPSFRLGCCCFLVFSCAPMLFQAALCARLSVLCSSFVVDWGVACS